MKTVNNKDHELKRTLERLREFKDSLDNFSAPANLNGWSLSNLPTHFWESLGESIDDIDQYIKKISL